jgi:isopentenyl diphosphate isomerase/L-lactate dehydrogenase-like FMN-dependent dehydrogenase
MDIVPRDRGCIDGAPGGGSLAKSAGSVPGALRDVPKVWAARHGLRCTTVSRLDRTYNVDDVRSIAKRRLPRAIFEVIEGGSGDEHTLVANRADLNSLRLLPRTFADVSNVDTSVDVLGQKMTLPLLLAPCSFGRMCDPGAERAVAAAAGAAGTGYVMPGGASETIESVAEASTGPLWYQLYLSPQDAMNEETLDRLKRAGVRTLVVAVDTPIMPYRERDMRNGITLPLEVTPRVLMAGASRPRWAKNFILGNRGSGISLTAARDAYYNFETAMSRLRPVTLSDIEWLRERWSGPLVVKGVLNDDRIRELVSIGVNAVIVSNHGGRNIDGVTSPIAALPRIVQSAGGDLEVLVDGGIRRGVDVVRAVALGASACLIGRPYLYGLAAGGQAGVERVLQLMHAELRVAMAMLGCTNLGEVDATLLANGPAHS